MAITCTLVAEQVGDIMLECVFLMRASALLIQLRDSEGFKSKCFPHETYIQSNLLIEAERNCRFYTTTARDRFRTLMFCPTLTGSGS